MERMGEGEHGVERGKRVHEGCMDLEVCGGLAMGGEGARCRAYQMGT